MKKYWKHLNDDFFVNYILTVMKGQYFGADYFLYTCKLFNSLIHACGKSINNNLKILDAGCGTGLPDFYLERKGAEIYLLDYSNEAIRNTKKHQLKLKSKNAYYLLGDIKTIPFEDNIFDVVWSEGVIEHFKEGDRDKIIKEMVRVIKPGGFIILMTPNLFTPHALGIKQVRRLLNKFPFDDWGKERAYSSKQLGKLLINLGLKDVRVESCNLPRTILDDFLMSYPLPLHRIKIFDKIRDTLIEFEERYGDLKCGFISGAIGVKNGR